jgi:UDP-glucuronate decarboxylase
MVRGLRTLMDTEGLQGEVINLGNEREITIMELAETILSTCDTESGVTYEPLPKDDPARRRPNLTKARERLDFVPSVNLQTGLERTIDWFAETLNEPQ